MSAPNTTPAPEQPTQPEPNQVNKPVLYAAEYHSVKRLAEVVLQMSAALHQVEQAQRSMYIDLTALRHEQHRMLNDQLLMPQKNGKNRKRMFIAYPVMFLVLGVLLGVTVHFLATSPRRTLL
ncbi:hypothetical protein GGR57DRAFT_504702 [Xylariaceae sp. FL1272]|nr:hypothetical protein GGR57DRAFT_504702 [Xylariaceae sp. FL1272]